MFPPYAFASVGVNVTTTLCALRGAIVPPVQSPLNPGGRAMLLTVMTELPVVLLVRVLVVVDLTRTPPKVRLPPSEATRVGPGVIPMAIALPFAAVVRVMLPMRVVVAVLTT